MKKYNNTNSYGGINMNEKSMQRLYGIKFGDDQVLGVLAKDIEQIQELIITTFDNRYQSFSKIDRDSINIDTTKLRFNFNSQEFGQVVQYKGTLQLFYLNK